MASAFLVVAVLLAIVLAGYFLGPINLIKQGVRKLVSGDYEQHLNINRRDELGQLARDFNLLASTLKSFIAIKTIKTVRGSIPDINRELRKCISINRTTIIVTRISSTKALLRVSKVSKINQVRS